MSNIIIRQIEPNDRAVWASLWRDYLLFYETTRDDAIYDRTFAVLLSNEYYKPRGALAWQNDEAIGLVHYLYHEHCWNPSAVCYLQDLYVAQNIRGTGVGRQLIEYVYAAADEDQLSGVYWMTQDFNTNARKLYDRIAKLTPFVKYQR